MVGEPLDPITMPTPGDAGCPPPGEGTLTRKDAVQQARARRARGEQGRVTGTAVTTELPHGRPRSRYGSSLGKRG